MNKIIILFLLSLTLSSCSITSTEEIVNPNIKEINSLCKSLCQTDKEAYCLEERTLIFENLNSTTGTCRSFSKYNREIMKCKSFCQEYGKENGCQLENLASDPNCDGN